MSFFDFNGWGGNMTKKPKPGSDLTREHHATLRRHASLLESHQRAIDKLSQANQSMVAALKVNGISVAKLPSPDDVRAGIADAMSSEANKVDPATLKDDDKVVVLGGAAAQIQFLGKLNHEFWSDNAWHVLPKDLVGVTVIKLIKRILSLLGGH
jgi:hypothetical protein